MGNSEKTRKGKIITLGEDIKNLIPRCMDNIFKIEETAVTDDTNLGKDETFRMYTIRTILVEGTTVVRGGEAVNVNGEFDIPLVRRGEQDEDDLVDGVYSQKEDAITAWEILTKAQLEKAEEEKARLEKVVNTLSRSYNERQY